MRIDGREDLRILFLDSDGPVVSTSEDTSDLIGNAWAQHAGIIVIPATRLDPAFFDLGSLKAGEITQRFVNYRLRLVIVGDITAFEEASSAFRDYVWESNRGTHVWFTPDEDAFERMLAANPL